MMGTIGELPFQLPDPQDSPFNLNYSCVLFGSVFHLRSWSNTNGLNYPLVFHCSKKAVSVTHQTLLISRLQNE